MDHMGCLLCPRVALRLASSRPAAAPASSCPSRSPPLASGLDFFVTAGFNGFTTAYIHDRLCGLAGYFYDVTT